MYKVIRYFTDAQDGERPYNVGDVYPREGLNPSDSRIRDLRDGNNFQRVALIEFVPDPKPSDESAEAFEVSKDDLDIEKIKKTRSIIALRGIANRVGVSNKDKNIEELRADILEALR